MAISIDDLNCLHIDVLREIGNIGSGNAATALAKMLDKKVDMDVPKVKILEFRDVTEILGGAEILVVGILLKVTGDLTGNMMFILEEKSAHLLVDILMGRSEHSIDKAGGFDEIEASALREIGNILASSYLSALTSLTGLKIIPSVPEMAIDMAGAILSVPAIQFGSVGDTVLYIETEFFEGSKKVVGDFFLVPDVESYDILLKALGVIS
ncbi:CheY-P-specific phosphatase CheC [Clostridium thermosuccinogenes]|jgi:chemotaxis protein CheC|uniref:CheY-P-specific phosphatase CheC n=1 Tax=Clostridium thermosuccinogenes TaxID=84032 RepID=A0A2K2FPG4_9CLOT|nr:chemotaxis protein CheC [Pseudoclostridium thermosuccinogenes]AUS96350.1 CheY-P-specific phosphatase CheC [Pseudoclostridium thermosuccinogenes]PNT98564.1 CheY-P-specific phosphatase CheC [Pseudoclostridium thermosuccinogenes]PNU00666.1 CheY-P-specific phosphatase CheC [Pseudoclostridium thermosuccinogenes]